MKQIKIIENEELWNLELFDHIGTKRPTRASRFTIEFNCKIIDDAKTLKWALSKFDKKAIKNNLKFITK